MYSKYFDGGDRLNWAVLAASYVNRPNKKIGNVKETRG